MDEKGERFEYYIGFDFLMVDFIVLDEDILDCWLFMLLVEKDL